MPPYIVPFFGEVSQRAPPRRCLATCTAGWRCSGGKNFTRKFEQIFGVKPCDFFLGIFSDGVNTQCSVNLGCRPLRVLGPVRCVLGSAASLLGALLVDVFLCGLGRRVCCVLVRARRCVCVPVRARVCPRVSVRVPPSPALDDFSSVNLKSELSPRLPAAIGACYRSMDSLRSRMPQKTLPAPGGNSSSTLATASHSSRPPSSSSVTFELSESPTGRCHCRSAVPGRSSEPSVRMTKYKCSLRYEAVPCRSACG